MTTYASAMKLRPLLLAALLAGAACGEDHHEGADAEGCEHLQKGPSMAVTAAAASVGAPAVAADHKRYDIALVDVAGGKGGVVTFAAPEATDFAFFLNAPVPVKFQKGGSPIAPEEMAASSSACADIKGRYVVPLSVGTVELVFGPTTATSVGLVIEEAGHGH